VSQQINLYNPLFLKQEKHFSARTMAQALGIIALGLAALYVYAMLESAKTEHSAQRQREQLAAQQDQLVKLGTQLATFSASKALEAEVARAEAAVKTRQATLEALNAGELGNTAGFSDFFAAFGRRSMAGVWLTGFNIGDAGNELVVRGRALQADLVPAYLRALNSEAMMRGRSIVEMKLAATQDQFVEFTLVAPRARQPASKGSNP
jgi:hypothetical protein